MTDIIWEEPPEQALQPRRATPYTAFAAALRSRPQQWARVPGERQSAAGAKGTAANLRRGKMVDFKNPAEWEVAVDGTVIWMRFIGPAAEGAEDSSPAAAAPPRANADQVSRKIRAWGQANGHELSEQGRLPRSVIEAYQRAHPHQADVETDELLDEADQSQSPTSGATSGSTSA